MVGHDSFGDRLFEYLVNCSRMHLFSQHTHVFILCFQDDFEQIMACFYIISPHSMFSRCFWTKNGLYLHHKSIFNSLCNKSFYTEKLTFILYLFMDFVILQMQDVDNGTLLKWTLQWLHWKIEQIFFNERKFVCVLLI